MSSTKIGLMKADGEFLKDIHRFQGLIFTEHEGEAKTYASPELAVSEQNILRRTYGIAVEVVDL